MPALVNCVKHLLYLQLQKQDMMKWSKCEIPEREITHCNPIHHADELTSSRVTLWGRCHEGPGRFHAAWFGSSRRHRFVWFDENDGGTCKCRNILVSHGQEWLHMVNESLGFPPRLRLYPDAHREICLEISNTPRSPRTETKYPAPSTCAHVSHFCENLWLFCSSAEWNVLKHTSTAKWRTLFQCLS